MKNVMRWFAAAALAATAACGGGEDNAADSTQREQAEKKPGFEMQVTDESGKKIDFNISEDGLNLSRDGEPVFSAGEGARLPNNFPKDVYVLDDAVVVMATGADGAGWTATLSTEMDRDAVEKKYMSAMSAAGWEQKAVTRVADTMTMLHYEKDERTATVAISSDEEAVRIVLSAQDKP